MILHLCESCEQVLNRQGLAEHDARGHQTASVELLLRRRGKGDRVETQWSTAWKKDAP